MSQIWLSWLYDMLNEDARSLYILYHTKHVWRVMRQDDNGVKVEVIAGITRTNANELLSALGTHKVKEHKMIYWKEKFR